MGRDAYAVMTSTLGALDSYQLAEHLNRDIAHSSIVLRAARDMVQFWNEEHQREFGRPAFALENLGPEWRADEALEAARPNQKYPRPTTALLPGLMRLELLEHVAALKLGPRWLGLGIPGLRTPSRRAARALRDALGGSAEPVLFTHSDCNPSYPDVGTIPQSELRLASLVAYAREHRAHLAHLERTSDDRPLPERPKVPSDWARRVQGADWLLDHFSDLERD